VLLRKWEDVENGSNLVGNSFSFSALCKLNSRYITYIRLPLLHFFFPHFENEYLQTGSIFGSVGVAA